MSDSNDQRDAKDEERVRIARRRLLKTAVYAAPTVLSFVAVSDAAAQGRCDPSCNPFQSGCNPCAAPCNPDTCNPAGP